MILEFCDSRKSRRIQSKTLAKLREHFESLGFTRSNANHAVFYKREDNKLIIVAVYVDDMLIFSDAKTLIDRLKADCKARFEMTDLGEARWILGMELINSAHTSVMLHISICSCCAPIIIHQKTMNIQNLSIEIIDYSDGRRRFNTLLPCI